MIYSKELIFNGIKLQVLRFLSDAKNEKSTITKFLIHGNFQIACRVLLGRNFKKTSGLSLVD